MNYKEYTAKAFDIAKRHGFHDKEMPEEHWLMLIISEISEMVESDRLRYHAQEAMFKEKCNTAQPNETENEHWKYCFNVFIKDTVEDEMADVCIRIFDLAGLLELELEEPKELNDIDVSDIDKMVRAKPFTQKAFTCCCVITRGIIPLKKRLEMVLDKIRVWAKSEQIDIEWHIQQKMKYNDMRSKKHGKQY